MIFNYFENEKKLLYYEHGADKIPDEIIAEFCHKDVTHIDFSSNSLVSIDCISYFAGLREIILDNNFLADEALFPARVFHTTHVLSLNNNKLGDLNQLIENLCHTFPNLRHLSLLGNPLCPALNQNFNEDDYQNYRLFIISRMPKLKFLDARMITRSEWSIIHSPAPIVVERSENRAAMDRMSLWRKIFKTMTPGDSPGPEKGSNSECYTPLPPDNDGNAQTVRSSYSRVRHQYKGTDSQGNRFIGNTML